MNPPEDGDDPSTHGVVVLDGTFGFPAALGGKGAALDRLLGWGVPVPPTAMVTADAYRVTATQAALAPLMERIARDEPVAGEEVEAAFLDAGLPEPLRTEVCAAARSVGDGRPLAIRSSATVEDLGGSSFAGQYRSVLEVPSDDEVAVEQAVLRVFASLLYPAPRAYRDALGFDSSDIAMAAVVMQMVDTVRAGVVFTQDPTIIEPTIRVEVVDGLGESLVSGKRTPRVHQFARNEGGVAPGSPGLDTELAQIITLAIEIEQHAGCPQDIEWAHDGSTLWIVQARPVTATRNDSTDPFDDPTATLQTPGSTTTGSTTTGSTTAEPTTAELTTAELTTAELTTEGIGEMLPGVLPPLVWQVAAHMVEDGFRTMLDRLGADVSAAAGPTWLLRRIRGRAALDVSRLGALMQAIPGADARVRAAYFGEEAAQSAQSAPSAPSAPFTTSSTNARATTPARTSRRAVAEHRRRAAAARRRAVFDAEVMFHVAEVLAGAVQADGAQGCDLASLEAATLIARQRELVRHATRAMTAELTVSADAGAIHAAVRTLLTRYLDAPTADTWAARITVPEGSVPTSSSASAAVFAGPTWDELGMQPNEQRAGLDRNDLLNGLATALSATPGWPGPGLRRRFARRRLEHLADRASLQFTRREQTKAAILLIGGEIRRIHLECGRRLVAQGRLAEPGDVDLLAVHEMESMLLDGVGPSVREVDRRRRTLSGHRAAAALPARWTGLPPDAPAAAVADGVLHGWAASSGRFVGRARRVNDPRDPIGRDEVLVASATDPSWSPILLRCGALVLERGGPLSHAAILAREFGVPAVFNITGAVEALDGKELLVDGDAGTVTVLDGEGRQ